MFGWKSFKQHHLDLFTYLKADEIHPHDRFIAWALLRFFPLWVTPNQITCLRVLATPVVFLLILEGWYKIGIVIFLLVALTDAIDGSMARTRNMITRFGMLFDPLADKLFIGSLVFLLVFRLNTILATAVLLMEVAIILSALVAKVKFKTIHMANRWGKIKMIFQVIAVFLTLIALTLEFPILLTISAGLFGVAIGFAVLSFFSHSM